MTPDTPIDDDGRDHPIIPWLTQPRRAWLYRLSPVVAALAVAYGLVADEKAPLWVAAFIAIVSPGVAAVNTPTR